MAKILVVMTDEVLPLLDELAAEDAERLGRNKDRSATVRDLVKSEVARRQKSKKKSSLPA